jgi:hypothetical protein
MIEIHCNDKDLFGPLMWAALKYDCVQFMRTYDYQCKITARITVKADVSVDQLRCLARLLNRAADYYEVEHPPARLGELPF